MTEAPQTIDFEATWAEARARLEAYLEALHLTNPDQQCRIVTVVLDRAAERYAEDPLACPVTLAMEELHDLSDDWFSSLLDTQDRPEARGIVSLLAVNVSEKWPSAFLELDVPGSLQCSVRQCNLRAAPDLQLSRMIPQPFASPLPESTLKQLARGLVPLTTRLFAFVLSALSVFLGRPLR